MKKKRSLLLLGCLVSWLGASVVQAAPANDKFPFEVQSRTLKNGLKVVVVPTGMPNLVSLYIPVSTGSRNEVEPGKSGFAHFFEHMMFRGTKTVSKEDWNKALLESGASQNAYTSNDLTNYHTLFGKADLEKWLKLEADRFQNLDYSEEGFKTEARAVLGEYNKNSSNPWLKLYEAQRDAVYSVHPYKHTTMGFVRDIEDMPNQFAYSKEFFKRWYRPDNVAVVIVGDVEAKQAFALTEKYFGGWKSPKVTVPAIPAEPVPTAGFKDVHVSWASPTSPMVWVGFRTDAKFSTKDKSSAALQFLGDIGFGSESALYERLVVREQKVTELYAFGGDDKDPSIFNVVAQLNDIKDLAYVRDAILDTCAGLVVDPPNEARLVEAKDKAEQGFVRQLDSANKIAGFLSRLIAFERDPDVVTKLLNLQSQVTAQDVAQAAKNTFTDARKIVSTLATGALPSTFFQPSATLVERQAKLNEAVADVRVIELANAKSPLVTFRFQLRVGSVHDPKNKEGLAQLAASLVFDGATKQRSYSELNKAWAAFGGGPEVIVDKERTTIALTVPKAKAKAALSLLSEQLLQSALDKADFERVRAQQRQGLEVGLKGNNDEELGKIVLENRMYVGPYAHPVLGTRASLDRLTLDDVQKFIAAFYVRPRFVAGLAGGYDSIVKAKTTQLVAAMPTQDAPRVMVNEAEHRVGGSSLAIIKKDTRATAISFGVSLRERDGKGTPIDARINRQHPDFAALWVATSYLGQHRNSTGVLYQTIREKRGINYGDYTYLEAFPNGMFKFQPDPGVVRFFNHWQAWIRPTKPENAAFALKAALYEIDRLRRDGMTQQAFEASRAYLIQVLDHFTDTESKRLGHDMDTAWFGFGSYAETFKDKLRALTLEQVNAAANKYLKTKDLDIVVVTKDPDAFVAAVLGEVAPKPKYEVEKPELAQEDDLIAKFPVDLTKERVTVTPLDQLF